MKKYFSEDHYKFHTIKLPHEDKGRILIYFKRVPVANDQQTDNIYSSLNNFIQFPQTNSQLDKGEIPQGRSLIIMNFDMQFEVKPMMKLFRICGDIRRVFTGQLKIQDDKKKKQVYVGIVIFKNEFDLTKCFNIDYFQSRIDQKYYVKKGDGYQNYVDHVLQYEVEDEERNKYVQEAMNEGFTIKTDKHGNFPLEYEGPQFEKNWVGRNKNKTKKVIPQEEILQVIKGYDEPVKSKDVKKQERQKLIQQFEQDKERLKRIKS